MIRYMQAYLSGGGFGLTISIKQVFICNNVIHLKASLQFIFILQLTTRQHDTTGMTTTVLEVTTPIVTTTIA